MREIRQTSRFKKDYKAAVKRGLPKGELRAVIEALANDEPLPERCRPHMLSGNWSGHWECHIRADWLLFCFAGPYAGEVVLGVDERYVSGTYKLGTTAWPY